MASETLTATTTIATASPPPSLKRKEPPSSSSPNEPRVKEPASPAALIGSLVIESKPEAKLILPNGAKQGSDDDYEKGIVVCSTCGEGISFRDSESGGFTLRLWDMHKLKCRAKHDPAPDPIVFTPETTIESMAHPPLKKRRSKRTEEERIEYLRTDPYVAQFEAYRVLCASCNKWIRLRPNSTYCSIPWDAHRKSCLAKKASAKASVANDARSQILSGDPYVRKFDSDRVLCASCDNWIQIGHVQGSASVQIWLSHRDACQHAGIAKMSHTAVKPSTNGNISSSNSASSQTAAPRSPQHHHVSPSSPASSSGFKEFNMHNIPSGHESRRRNAEQREAALRADPLLREVEPNRVFCNLCLKWVQLRQDSSFCAYPWHQHRGKCLARHRRRLEKANGTNGVRQRSANGGYYVNENGQMESEDDRMSPDQPESEEGVDSDEDAEAEDDDEEDGMSYVISREQMESHVRHSNGGQANGNGGDRRPTYHHRDSVSSMSDMSSVHTNQSQQHYHNQGPPPPPSSRSGHQSPYSNQSGHSYSHTRPPMQHSHSYSHPSSQSHSSYSHSYGQHPPPARSASMLLDPGGLKRPSARRANSFGGLPNRLLEEEDVQMDTGGSSTERYSSSGNDRSSSQRTRFATVPPPPTAPHLADLDSSWGRMAFISGSVDYLFRTTYESSDEMTIAALVNYLNGAMPMDKHEDFDVAEVTKAAVLLDQRGNLSFKEGLIHAAR